MHLRLSHVRQTGGPAWVVKYDAEVILTPDDPRVLVEVESTFPADADPSLVAEAAESIRRGAERAFQGRGYGANMVLRRLVIHDVDFYPLMFERLTAEEISRALDADA